MKELKNFYFDVMSGDISKNFNPADYLAHEVAVKNWSRI